ncbi:hypothetical protein ABPG72_017461 [Tetrahymena utriculariae]
MRSKEKKSGNSCLYCLYNLFNVLFMLQSLLVIAMGAWLWYEVKKIGPFNLGFILLGLIEFLLSLFGQQVKKSRAKMNCYLLFLFLLFTAQAIIASVAIASKDKIIDWASQRADSPQEAQHIKDLIQNNVNTCIYITFAALSIQMLCIWTVWAYKKSFIARNITHEFLIEQEDGRKISLQEHQQKQKEEISAKYDRLRKEEQKRFDSAYSSDDSNSNSKKK